MDRVFRAASVAACLVFVPLALAAGPRASTLAGVVTENGTPVAGARVHAVHVESKQVSVSAPTAADGSYRLAALAFGYYDVVVETTAGVFLGNRVVNLPAGETLRLSLAIGAPQPEDTEWWSAETTRTIPGLERTPDGVARIIEDRPAGRRISAKPEAEAPLAGDDGGYGTFRFAVGTTTITGARSGGIGDGLEGGTNLAISYEHRYSRTFGLEFAAQYVRAHDTTFVPTAIDGSGTVLRTNLEIVPVTLAAMFHPFVRGRYDVSIGPTVGLIHYRGSVTGTSIDEPFRFDDEVTWGARARLEARLGGPWTIATSVDYLHASAQPSAPYAAEPDQTIRPLTVQLSVGRRY